MSTRRINRRDLLDILGGAPKNNISENPDIAAKDGDGEEITGTWRESEPASDSLPSIITMPQEAHREFLAWAYTYLSTVRPFTAFIRLLSPELTEKVLRRAEIQEVGQFHDAFIALIIAESASYFDARSDFILQLTPTACENSHSYALAKALALGFGDLAEQVSASWASVRDLTKQRSQPHGIKDLRTVFDALTACRDPQAASSNLESEETDLVKKACRQIAYSGDINDQTWFDLIGSWRSLVDIRQQMTQSRERRIRAFDKAWRTIATEGGDPNRASFAAGYIASRIGPGEMEHLSILARSLRDVPGALLWFGVCSGLRSNGQVLTFASGLGRRILRDLEQIEPPLAKPRCDLAVEELQILLGNDKPWADFRTANNGLLSVELLPSVTTTVRWSRTTDQGFDLPERGDLPIKTLGLIRDLSVTLGHAESIRKRLQAELDLGTKSQVGKPLQKPKG